MTRSAVGFMRLGEVLAALNVGRAPVELAACTFGLCQHCRAFVRLIGPRWIADIDGQLWPHFTCSACNSTRVPARTHAIDPFRIRRAS